MSERITPTRGEVLVPLDEHWVREAARWFKAEGVEAIPVCFLLSYIDPAHEVGVPAGRRGVHRGPNPEDPSGGGYGNPFERPAEQVLDVLDGYISVETAARDYGVVVDERMQIDREATARARPP